MSVDWEKLKILRDQIINQIDPLNKMVEEKMREREREEATRKIKDALEANKALIEYVITLIKLAEL